MNRIVNFNKRWRKSCHWNWISTFQKTLKVSFCLNFSTSLSPISEKCSLKALAMSFGSFGVTFDSLLIKVGKFKLFFIEMNACSTCQVVSGLYLLSSIFFLQQKRFAEHLTFVKELAYFLKQATKAGLPDKKNDLYIRCLWRIDVYFSLVIYGFCCNFIWRLDSWFTGACLLVIWISIFINFQKTSFTLDAFIKEKPAKSWFKLDSKSLQSVLKL